MAIETIQDWLDVLLVLIDQGYSRLTAIDLLGDPPENGRHVFMLRGGKYVETNEIEPPYKIYLNGTLLEDWFNATWTQRLNEPDTLTFSYPANRIKSQQLCRGGGKLYLRDVNDTLLGTFRIRNFAPSYARTGGELVVNVDAESLLAVLDDSAILTYSPGKMTLADDIDDDDLSFDGEGESDYPSGSIRIMIDSEIMTGSLSGSTFTITSRGVDGTEVKEHKKGAKIRLALTIRKHVERLFDDYNVSGVEFGDVYSDLDEDKIFVAFDNMTLLDAIRQLHTLSGRRGQYRVAPSEYFYWVERINENSTSVFLGYNLESWSRQEDATQLCTVLIMRGAGANPETRINLPSFYVDNNVDLYGPIVRVIVRDDISDQKTLELVANELIKELSVPALHYTCSAADSPDTAYIKGIGSKVYLSDSEVSISNIELNVVGITRSLDNPNDVTYEFDRKAVNTESIIETLISRIQRVENRDIATAIVQAAQNNAIQLPAQGIPWETPGTIGGTTPNTGKFTTLEATGTITTNGMIDRTGSQTIRSKPTAGEAQIYLAPNPQDGTSTATLGIFRTTNTSGTRQLVVYKGDGSNTVECKISNGKIYTRASTSDAAGIVLPHGVAPSSPSNGDMWTTKSGMYVRINGTTIGPLGSAKWKRYGGA